MSSSLCKKCSGYPLEVIIADNMDMDRACLCFDQEHDIVEDGVEEE